MKPPSFPIEVYQGDNFSMFMRVRALTATGEPGAYIDLTGSTPKAQIRSVITDTEVAAEFTCTLGDQGTFPGSLFVELDHITSGSLTGNGVYDVEVTHLDGRVITYLMGTMTLVKEVTRP